MAIKLEVINRALKENWIKYMSHNPEYFKGLFGYEFDVLSADQEFEKMRGEGLVARGKISAPHLIMDDIYDPGCEDGWGYAGLDPDGERWKRREKRQIHRETSDDTDS